MKSSGAVGVAREGGASFSAAGDPSSPEWRVPFAGALALAALSALLLYLSFPHPGQSWLAWVAVVPLLLACRGQGPWRGALLGFVAGYGFQGTLLSWSTFFGPVAFLGLVAFKSVGPALMGASLGVFRSRSALVSALFAGAAWIAMEWYQTLGPLGMTWGMLGHSQARVPMLIQLGALVGPWGTSLVLALANAALAEWLGRAWLAPERVGPARAAAAAGPALALAAGAAAFTVALGAWELAHPAAPSGPPVRWGVVQVSMPQDVKFDPSFQRETMGRLESLSDEVARRGARVVVWPETSIPYRQFLEFPGLTTMVGALAERLDSWLVVGSIERAGARATYNTASLFSPEGRFAGRYDKFRLVPFGEFLPWKQYLPKLQAFDLVMNYAPGDGLKLFEADGRPFAVLICYESMVTDLAREQVKRGAEFLVIPTNDAWFGRSSAAAHHFDMAIMRAVETRRPTIQAGNTGISGFVTPMGEVLAESKLDERTALVESLAPVTDLSLYTRIGDVLAFACLGLWAGLLAAQAWRGRASR